MDVPSSRLYEDLADAFRGELLIDPVACAAYACDASPFELQPLAVACPRDHHDVTTLLRYAAEHQLPVTPRGGGSGSVGGALGRGIIVDLSRHLRQIGPVEGDTIRVETGVTLEQLNRHLRPQGWMLGPDPMTSLSTTVGGMLAVNAAGSRARAFGDTRKAVRKIELVLADGQFVTARDVERNAQPFPSAIPASIATPVERLLSDQLLQAGGNNGAFAGVVTDQRMHWPKLLVGSEGTLGVFTAATLRLRTIPPCRGAILLAFRSLEAAILAVPALASADVAVCELLDRRLISLARETHGPWVDLFAPHAEAALLVEWFADSAAKRTERLHAILGVASHPGTGAEVCRVVLENDDVQSLSVLPASLLGMLARLPGHSRPLALLSDVTVPLEQMESAVMQVQRVLQQHGLSAALHAHAAVGSLHFLPLAPPPDGNTAALWSAVAEEVDAVVHDLGGTIGRHRGTGLAWAGSRHRQTASTRAVALAIKELFDPQGLLNPGKVVAEARPYPTDLFRPSSLPVNPQPLLLNWSQRGELSAIAGRCNGCGQCRTDAPEQRMCPFFRNTADELTAPRAKAHAVRFSENMPVEAEVWETESGRRLLASCFNCKQCLAECPSGVDIPRLVTEFRAQRVASHGLSRADWYLTRIPGWMPWLRYGAVALRPILRRAWFRWLVEKLTSITRHRRFPNWRMKPFLQTAPRAWRTPPAIINDRVVVYFIDHVANWHEPEIALAAGKILEHHGFQVYLPTEQVRSGMELVTSGDLERARALAEKNVSVLGEFARAGCRIVCTEPSAAVCLKMEYPRLLDHPDAVVVANAVIEIGGFLAQLETSKELRTNFQPRPVRAGYHLPCHLRALGCESPLQKICSLIPGVVSPKIDAGCSGMAGTFGWAKETYEQSVALGQPMVHAWESVAGTVALSECSSCRQQLEHLTHRRSQHPLVLLAEAYGLLPVTSPST